MYDYLIVGAGLFGDVFAHEMARRGRRCLVIDGRNYIDGNCYTEQWGHQCAQLRRSHLPHLGKWIWEYVNQFAE